ncbi:MAG: DUF1007 family protein [Hyphomicrobiaceae bacterium]
MRGWRNLGCLSSAAMVLAVAAGSASAHPHVWVEVESTIQSERGAFTGVRQRWTFDEFYSSMAIEGLDANKDGKVDRAELAELARVNMDGLKEFAYFTFAQLGGQKIGFAEPVDVVLEQVTPDLPPGPAAEPLPDAAKGAGPDQSTGATTAAPKPGEGNFWGRAWDALLGKGDPPPPEKPKVLVLEFTLPLAQPVLTEAEGFELQTYDPSFFIWFDLAKDNPARLSAGAPAGCAAIVRQADKDGGDAQRLGESFFNQMGGPTGANASSKSITVRCPKT